MLHLIETETCFSFSSITLCSCTYVIGWRVLQLFCLLTIHDKITDGILGHECYILTYICFKLNINIHDMIISDYDLNVFSLLLNVFLAVKMLKTLIISKSGLVNLIRRAPSSKLRGPGFKSQPGTVGNLITIIMSDALPGWKLALS